MLRNAMTISCFLFLLFIVFSSFTVSTYDFESNKKDSSLCESYGYKCGSQTYDVYYPFRLDTSPLYCGLPEFELSCMFENKSLVTHISGKEYKVNYINHTHHLLSVTDMSIVDYFEGQLCESVFRNTSVNGSPFSYSSNDVNLMILMNCSSDLSLLYHNLINFTCLGWDSPYKAYYNISSDVQDGVWNKCKSVAFIPIYQTFGVNLKHSYKEELMKFLLNGFKLSWKQNDTFCNKCMDTNGTCYTDEMGSLACYCSGGTISTDGRCVENRKKKNLGAVIGVVSSIVGGLLLGTCIILFLCLRRKRKPKASSTLFFQMNPGAAETCYHTHIFSYDELEKATLGFHESRELGHGGFGTVYKGKLRDGRTVAVKRLHERNRRLEQFINEIEILTRLRHQNLVTLYGCTSHDSRELLLVYEYIPNGTLADHLHGPLTSEHGLSWPTRMSIIIQTAEAISYLHSVEPPIIHRDIKTNNILLDDNFQVKVADFGISRLFPLDATHVSTKPQGTFGYVDPEYYLRFQLTDKSDVYSFAVVMIELISSKAPVDIRRNSDEISLANMAITKIRSYRIGELVDPNLRYEEDLETREMIDQVAQLAYRCLQSDAEMRPGIKEVLGVLRSIRGEFDADGIGCDQVMGESALLSHVEVFSTDYVTGR